MSQQTHPHDGQVYMVTLDRTAEELHERRRRCNARLVELHDAISRERSSFTVDPRVEEIRSLQQELEAIRGKLARLDSK